MTGVTHKLGGILTGVILADQFCNGTVESTFVVAGAVLGSLLPDIDNQRSTIGGMMPGTSILVRAGQKTIRLFSHLFPRKVAEDIRSLIGHRGILHSLVAPFVVAAAALLQKNTMAVYFFMAVAIGMVSHLILDLFSGGVPLFMPFSMKRIKLAGIRTGGMLERIIAVIIGGSCVPYLMRCVLGIG